MLAWSPLSTLWLRTAILTLATLTAGALVSGALVSGALVSGALVGPIPILSKITPIRLAVSVPVSVVGAAPTPVSPFSRHDRPHSSPDPGFSLAKAQEGGLWFVHYGELGFAAVYSKAVESRLFGLGNGLTGDF